MLHYFTLKILFFSQNFLSIDSMNNIENILSAQPRLSGCATKWGVDNFASAVVSELAMSL
jgi:hypothetical protein